MNYEVVENYSSKLFLQDLRDMGFGYCSLGLCTKRSILSFFSHISWQERYQVLRLFEDDPLYQMAIHTHRMPILWSAVPKKSIKAASIMKLRYEMTDTTSGVTISFSKDGLVSMLALGAKASNVALLHIFNKNIGLIQLKVYNLQCQLFKFP